MQSQKGPRQAETPAGKAPFANGVAGWPVNHDAECSGREHTMGRLAVDVAHSMKNLLTVMAGCCDLLRQRTEVGCVPPELTEMNLAVTRAVEVAQRWLCLCRPHPAPPERVHVNVLIQEVAPLLECITRGRVALRLALAPSLPVILGRADVLEEVLINLVGNARDACTCGGEVVVETAEVWLPRDLPHRHDVVPAGPWVVLRVVDTGCGMDEATQARLFEPFFTTKPAGKGTGVGLAIVHKAVHEHNGHVVVHSTLGCGSTFEVYLPPLAD